MQIIVDGHTAPPTLDPDARIGDNDDAGPELGNLLFGHSRGRYHIPRGVGFEEEFERLTGLMESASSPLGHSYLSDKHDCSVFTIRPYDWDAECTCGFNAETEQWWSEHQHTHVCFCVRYKEEEARLRSVHGRGKDKPSLVHSALVAWARANNYAAAPYGMAVHCDCGVDELHVATFGGRDHTEQCRLSQPNFHHKPSGFELEWYKYPFRDSYANQPLTLREFAVIVDECIAAFDEER